MQQRPSLPQDLKSHCAEGTVPSTSKSAEQYALLICSPLVGAREGEVCGSINSVAFPSWDVVVVGPPDTTGQDCLSAAPGAYFKRLFLAVHMAGARAIGLEEQHRIQTEAGVATFPYDFAGTAAFDDDARAQAFQMCRSIGSRRKGQRFATFPSFSSGHNGSAASNMPIIPKALAVRTPPCTPILPTWLKSLSSSKDDDTGTVKLVGGNVSVLHRGQPSRLTRIYLPTADEIEDFAAYRRVHIRTSDFVRHSVPFSTIVVSKRSPVGCLTSGVFSRVRGRGSGIGYVDVSSDTMRQIWAQCLWVQSTPASQTTSKMCCKTPDPHLVLLHNARSTVLRPALFSPWVSLE
jgi:hypothetical protein